MPLADVGVEPLHRGGQPRAVEPGALAEGLERVGADGPRRDGVAGHAREHSVLGEELGVEDQPVRQVGELVHVGVEVVQGVAEGVVVERLVDEPLAVLVDHDRARAGALGLAGQVAGAGVAVGRGRLLGRRHPPGVGHVAEAGADLHRHEESVALALRDADRAGHRAAQEGLHQAVVPFEPAGGDDHTAAGPVAHGSAVALGDHADHPLALGDEGAGAGVEVDGDVAVEDAAVQRADQALALRPVVVGAATLDLLRADLLVVLLHPGDHLRQAGLRWVHPAGRAAELVEGVGLGVQRAAALGHRAEHVRLVVGEAGEQAQAARGVVGDEPDHLRAALQEALDGVGVQPLGGHRVEVVDDVLHGVLDAVLRLVVVQRDPQHPAGHRGGATDHARLLQDDHLAGPVVVGGEGGDQGGAATAEDHDIGLDIPAGRVVTHVGQGYLKLELLSRKSWADVRWRTRRALRSVRPRERRGGRCRRPAADGSPPAWPPCRPRSTCR